MIIENIKVLKADEGMRLTDGEIYAKTILLPENRSAEEFSEITEAEYIEIKKAKENEDGAEIH
jgi:hypothetical protein